MVEPLHIAANRRNNYRGCKTSFFQLSNVRLAWKVDAEVARCLYSKRGYLVFVDPFPKHDHPWMGSLGAFFSISSKSEWTYCKGTWPMYLRCPAKNTKTKHLDWKTRNIFHILVETDFHRPQSDINFSAVLYFMLLKKRKRKRKQHNTNALGVFAK